MELREVIGTIVALAIGIILFCSFLIPVALEQISALPESAPSQWGSLLRIVIMIAIVGLIAVAAQGFLSSRSK